MSEKTLISEIQLLFTQKGHRIFRQNTGTGWAGDFFKPPMETTIKVSPRDVVVRNARPLRAGLCTGSSDLIGWQSITITEDMIGKRVAIFTAIEVKHGSTRTTEEQKRFIESVNSSGGIGKIVRELNEVIL
jgi:hypothetical protein